MKPTLIAVSVLFVVVASGCARGEETPAVESASLDVTSWTDRTELYMEYPPLVAGRTARFAVHLTTLADFHALNAGRPHLEFTPEGGGPMKSLPGSDPLRPGAFRVEGVVPAPGKYRWALVIDGPTVSDRHDLGAMTVFLDEQTANADAGRRPPDDASAFAYLKEQQWTNTFATERAGVRDLRIGVRVSATIRALTGGEAIVSAPASGRFSAETLTAVGAAVQVGESLGRLEPRLTDSSDRATLTSDVAEARAALEAARTDQTRAEGLLAERAVPARRAEDARRAVVVAEARLRSSEARLTQRDQALATGGGAAAGNAFTLRAPIAGRVVAVMATLGASYDEGAPLFRIVRTDRVELRALVPSSDTGAVRDITGLEFDAPGRLHPVALTWTQRRDSGVLDEATRAVPVGFEVDNPAGQLVIGESGTAILYQRARARGVAVPKAAVLFEAGRPYVFIQVGGERFVRRYLEIATTDGEWTGIRSGLAEGDRVVTRGAYEVQLASAAKGLPAEGHVH